MTTLTLTQRVHVIESLVPIAGRLTYRRVAASDPH
jgi:hypothetical protein